MNKKLGRSSHPQPPTHLFIEILGWAGVAAIFGAYVLVVAQLILPTSQTYSLLNIFGSVGIVAESVTKKNYPPAILNILWACVAFIALFTLWIN